MNLKAEGRGQKVRSVGGKERMKNLGLRIENSEKEASASARPPFPVLDSSFEILHSLFILALESLHCSWLGKRFCLLPSAICLLVLVPSARASDLFVEPRRMRVNELATITVALEGTFAERDAVSVPLRNLAIVGEPWVSSEFAWINGRVSRRKTFRYRARPIAPGPALVGPLVLADAEGRRETLAAVAIDVVADRAMQSNDPRSILRMLLDEGREPVFVVAQVEPANALVGEPVIVTWMLYNATQVQQWQVAAIPNLADFWTEELPRRDEVESVEVGDVVMQRVPVRRAVLFPLRSGRLRVDGISVEVAVWRRSQSGRLAIYEGELVDDVLTSAPFEVEAVPLPPGSPVDLVGDLTLTCGSPSQRGEGPVVFDVVLEGAGNLRAAKPPRLNGPLEGTLRVEGGEIVLPVREGPFRMKRRWQALIFPSHGGRLEIPALSMSVFVPNLAARKDLRCEQRSLEARVATRPALSPGARTEKPRPRPALWRWIGAIGLMVLAGTLAARMLAREVAVRREAREILRGCSAAVIRERLEHRLGAQATALLSEASDRGDAWRAVRSLLDAAERDRDIAHDSDGEIARRVKDLIRAHGGRIGGA